MHSHGKMIRSLDSTEEIFLAVRSSGGSFCPVLLAEVEGVTTVDDWRRALRPCSLDIRTLDFYSQGSWQPPIFCSWAELATAANSSDDGVSSLTKRCKKNNKIPLEREWLYKATLLTDRIARDFYCSA